MIIDIETHKPLQVMTDGEAGPYLMVPLEQLEAVRDVLRRDAISHVVAEDAIQVDGGPFIAIVDFGRRGDAGRIQAALDRA